MRCGSQPSNNALSLDLQLLGLDAIADFGDRLASLGSAIAAAASAEQLDVLELALRQARAFRIEAIAGFRGLAPAGGEGGR